MVLDYVFIVVVEFGNIVDCCCYLLFEGLYGLLCLLIILGGLNLGMMIL